MAAHKEGYLCMARVTKADLEQLVTIIKATTGDDGYFVEYASGRPRLYHAVPSMWKGGEALETVSPRLSTRELLNWLDGFSEALLTEVFEEGSSESEEVRENPSYRSYYIYPDLTRQSWFIQKDGYHIATEASEEEAQRTVDDLLDDDE